MTMSEVRGTDPKFKVDDRVKVVNSDATEDKQDYTGRTGVVTSTETGNSLLSVGVKLDTGTEEFAMTFAPGELVLIEEEKPLSLTEALLANEGLKFSDEEVRVVDPDTGGQKGKKGVELGFIDPVALELLGAVASMGSEKYEPFNYLKGYSWSLSYNALQRHLMAFWRGEDLDPESGLPHQVHAAWHCLALTSFAQRELGTDDRPPKVEG